MTVPLSNLDNTETPETREKERDAPKKRIKITASNGWKVLHESASPAFLRRVSSRRRLERLPSLPMDVLFEIFGHLLPMDVLNLTRTTKEFRSVFLHRSAITIWKASFANVPKLPECPPEMSLPAWANLAFDLHCHNCGNSHVKNVVDFILRIRLCGPCAKICLLSSKSLDEESPKTKLVLKCVPFTKWNKNVTKSCLIKDTEEFMKSLANPNCHRQEFTDKKRAEVKIRREHGKRCRAWLDEEIEAQEKALNAIRKDRMDAIIEKLVDLGYGEECDYLDDLEHDVVSAGVKPGIQILSKHASVKIPKPLTDQVWSNIKSKMIRYMKQVRLYIASEDRRKLVEARKGTALDAWYDYRQKTMSAHGSTLPIPSPLDIWEMPEVHDIVELPSSQQVTLATFTTVFDNKMSHFLWRFGTTEVNKLAAKHPCDAKSIGQFHEVRKIELATCVFTCTAHHLHSLSNDPDILASTKDSSYEQPLFHPEFLHHPCTSICMTQSWYAKGERDTQTLDANIKLSVGHQFSGCRRKKWSSDKLVPHEKAARVVRKIVEACGMDPATTTVRMMDRMDPRLVCLKCTFGGKADGERRCSVWTWRNAVKHCLKAHWGVAVAWQEITPEDAEEAKALELREPTRRKVPPPEDRIWRCTACLDTPGDLGRMTWQEIRTHYRQRGGIDVKSVHSSFPLSRC
ncbi:hypothetical protein FPV67DRAFT_1403986 [Lyophyllum atratum]|nr:hypothetical protein FPV67DRAFT_1403986 [Lyophyllum atratum]